MKIWVLALLLVGGVTEASAQSRFTLPTADERQAANVVSWFTVAANVGLDAKAAWDCPPSKRTKCFGLLAAKDAGTYGTAWVIKKFLPVNRPCAPNDCGSDSPNSDVPSAHTALAVASLNINGRECGVGPRYAFSLPLAFLTAGGRYTSRRHDLIGLATGMADGFVWSELTRCR